MMQLVQDRPDPLYVAPPTSNNTAYAQYQFLQQNIDVWLDCVPNTDPVPLPAGVGIAFVADVTSPYPQNGSTSPPVNDRYIGFNTINDGNFNKSTYATIPLASVARTNNDTTNNIYGSTNANPPGNGGVRWGNVILFDTTGNLVALRWGLRMTTTVPNTSTNPQFQFTKMGRLLYGIPDAALNSNMPIPTNSYMANYPDLIPRDPACFPGYTGQSDNNTSSSVLPLRSALAFVLFDQPHYDAKNFVLVDPNKNDPTNGESNETIFNDPGKNYDDGTNPTSTARMLWLDQSTTALMINRYNATLIKAE
jgi:hypothetical protein